MTTRTEILAEARTWLGTPFVHQGRLKGIACDCAGLVRGVAASFNLTDFDKTDYPRSPDTDELTAICEEHMVQVPIQQVRPGDVVRLRLGKRPQHLAFVGDYPKGGTGLSLIHAYETVRKPSSVIEHRLDSIWHGRIVAAYRIPGLED